MLSTLVALIAAQEAKQPVEILTERTLVRTNGYDFEWVCQTSYIESFYYLLIIWQNLSKTTLNYKLILNYTYIYI